MYGRGPTAIGSGGTGALAFTGVAAYSLISWAVALMIAGGMLVLLASTLKSRLAVEPVRLADGKHHLRITRNGRPLGDHRHS